MEGFLFEWSPKFNYGWDHRHNHGCDTCWSGILSNVAASIAGKSMVCFVELGQSRGNIYDLIAL